MVFLSKKVIIPHLFIIEKFKKPLKCAKKLSFCLFFSTIPINFIEIDTKKSENPENVIFRNLTPQLGKKGDFFLTPQNRIFPVFPKNISYK